MQQVNQKLTCPFVCITFWISCAEKMPRGYGEDLRWRAIFLAEIVGIDIEEVSFYLQISKMTIYRYIDKFRTVGNISTGIIGRPVGCISFHPHEEFVIMELILNHPEKTIAELVQEVYLETGSVYPCSSIFYYLKRNSITRKKVSSYLHGMIKLVSVVMQHY